MEVSQHSLPYPFEFPAEWPIALLGNVSDIKSGVTLGRTTSSIASRSLPYLRVANVQDGYLDLSEMKEILVTDAEAALFRLVPGDVLMIEGGDFDKLGRGTVWLGEIPECMHQNHVFRVRVDQSRLLPFFLSAFSASDFGRRYFLISSKQTTNLASINSSQLKRFPLPLPPLPQQRKIARILTTLDNVITQTEALIAKYQAIKQGLMHDLFTRGVDATGKLRPPQSEAPELYKQSQLGWIPKEWDIYSVGDLAEYVNGNSFNQTVWSTHGLPIIRIQNLNGNVDFNYYQGPVDTRWEVLPGDLLFAWSGMLETSFGPRIWLGQRGVLNQHIFKVIPNFELVEKTFLNLLLRQNLQRIVISAHGFKSSFVHVTRAELLPVPLPLPNPAEQERILKSINKAEGLVNREVQFNLSLNSIKTGLMQDLLTGKVPVKADEAAEGGMRNDE